MEYAGIPLKGRTYGILFIMEAKKTTKDVAQRFGVSPDTVRIWTTQFSAYLSPTASPEKGRQRNFTEEDMEILALIAAMKGQGSKFDEIAASLSAGSRGTVPDTIIPRTTVTTTEVRRQLQQVEQALNETTQELFKTQGENRLLKEQLQQRDTRITELVEENARLKIQREPKPPEEHP